MNAFDYLCMRSPQTGLLGPLWQYLYEIEMPEWQKMRSYTLADVIDVVAEWKWGAQMPEYTTFADRATKLQDGPSELPPKRVIA